MVLLERRSIDLTVDGLHRSFRTVGGVFLCNSSFPEAREELRRYVPGWNACPDFNLQQMRRLAFMVPAGLSAGTL